MFELLEKKEPFIVADNEQEQNRETKLNEEPTIKKLNTKYLKHMERMRGHGDTREDRRFTD